MHENLNSFDYVLSHVNFIFCYSQFDQMKTFVIFYILLISIYCCRRRWEEIVKGKNTSYFPFSFSLHILESLESMTMMILRRKIQFILKRLFMGFLWNLRLTILCDKKPWNYHSLFARDLRLIKKTKGISRVVKENFRFNCRSSLDTYLYEFMLLHIIQYSLCMLCNQQSSYEEGKKS